MGIWCISIRSCLKNPPLKIKVQKNINSNAFGLQEVRNTQEGQIEK